MLSSANRDACDYATGSRKIARSVLDPTLGSDSRDARDVIACNTARWSWCLDFAWVWGVTSTARRVERRLNLLNRLSLVDNYKISFLFIWLGPISGSEVSRFYPVTSNLYPLMSSSEPPLVCNLSARLHAAAGSLTAAGKALSHSRSICFPARFRRAAIVSVHKRT